MAIRTDVAKQLGLAALEEMMLRIEELKPTDAEIFFAAAMLNASLCSGRMGNDLVKALALLETTHKAAQSVILEMAANK